LTRALESVYAALSLNFAKELFLFFSLLLGAAFAVGMPKIPSVIDEDCVRTLEQKTNRAIVNEALNKFAEQQFKQAFAVLFNGSTENEWGNLSLRHSLEQEIKDMPEPEYRQILAESLKLNPRSKYLGEWSVDENNGLPYFIGVSAVDVEIGGRLRHFAVSFKFFEVDAGPSLYEIRETIQPARLEDGFPTRPLHFAEQLIKLKAVDEGFYKNYYPDQILITHVPPVRGDAADWPSEDSPNDYLEFRVYDFGVLSAPIRMDLIDDKQVGIQIFGAEYSLAGDWIRKAVTVKRDLRSGKFEYKILFGLNLKKRSIHLHGVQGADYGP
jgi:hypothetical protein